MGVYDMKIGDYVVIKRIISDETINFRKSIGRIGRIESISSNEEVRYKILVKFVKPIEHFPFLSYSEEELEKINENDVLAYLI